VPYRRITSIRDYSGGADIALTFDDGFFSIASMAAPLLEEHHCSATLFIITNTLSGGPVYDVYKNKKKLSPADLKDLSQRGFEIGSHTTSHRDLRQLSTSQCRYELEKSKGDLEDIINREVVSLSFPLGLWNRRVIRCAETAGYRNFSLYNGHGRGKKLSQNIFFAQGVYPFDTKGDMYKKFVLQTGFSSAFARSRILPHFAKGTAMVHTCEEYHPLRISPEVWSPFFSDAEQEKRTAHKKYKNR
jgi:peptidoglycan/xylan/chitin deacetylase (PgdA/CDA1 family)